MQNGGTAANQFPILFLPPDDIASRRFLSISWASLSCISDDHDDDDDDAGMCRYDNEYGYSNRVVDLLNYVYKRDHA